jgi:hypothetical protein
VVAACCSFDAAGLRNPEEDPPETWTCTAPRWQTHAGQGGRGCAVPPAQGRAGSPDTALTKGTPGGVRIITGCGQSWISVPKLDKLPEPRNLAAVQVEDRAVPRCSLPAEGIKVGRNCAPRGIRQRHSVR